MAAGDIKSAITSVAASGTLDIKPSTAGEEWVIHNIKYSGPVNFSDTDGTNTFQWDNDSSAGGRLGLTSHVNQSVWLRITNPGSSAIFISYDGIQTK